MGKVIYHLNEDWDYLKIPKCGCTSMLGSLAEARGLEPKDTFDIHERCAPLLPQGRRPGKDLLVVVRDPIERLISFYNDKIVGPKTIWTDRHPAMRADGLKRNMSFIAFIERIKEKGLHKCNAHLQPQWLFLEGLGDYTAVKIDHLYSLSLIGLRVEQRNASRAEPNKILLQYMEAYQHRPDLEISKDEEIYNHAI